MHQLRSLSRARVLDHSAISENLHSRYRCAKVARRDGYSVARHSSWLFRLFIAIVWQTGNGTMADTMEQRDGRAGIAVSSLVTSFVVAQGCRDKETPVAEARGSRRGQGFDEPESVKSIGPCENEEWRNETKKKGGGNRGMERNGGRVCIIYITVLKGKGLVFFSSFDMTLKRF